MKRAAPILVTAVVVAALVVGVVLLATGSGADAFTVNGHSVSQRTIDDELAVLHDNTQFSSSVASAQIVAAPPGSISSQVSASWMTIRILSILAKQALHSRGKHVTAADRKATGVKSSAGFKSLPLDFGREVIARVAFVRALQRVVGTDTAGINATLAKSCRSGRYASDILVADLATAQSLKKQLDGGANFAKLAAANSIDTNAAQQGGAVGCVSPNRFVKAFQQVASTLPVGVVSDPVHVQGSYHLILVSDTPSKADIDAATLSVLARIVRGARITVDPRYGTWDAQHGRLNPPTTPTTG